MTPDEKRPRHYAAEIVALPTAAQRRAALALVPDVYRPTVRTHVENFFARRAAARGNTP